MPSHLFIRLIAAVCFLGETASAVDQLHFINDDVLSGHFVSMDSESIRWATKAGGAPVQFSVNALKRLQLNYGDVPPLVSMDSHVLELTNGGKRCGRLVAVEGGMAVLDTRAGGRTSIPTENIREILWQNLLEESVYQGPSPGEWTSAGRGAEWTYHEKALFANGHASTAADLALPSQFVIEFEVSMRNQPAVNINVAAPDLKNQSADLYRINITRHGLNLYRRWQAKNRNQMLYTVSGDHLDVLRAPRLHIRLYVDRINRRLSLFLNGRFLKTVIDPIKEAPSGTVLQFYSYGAGQVRLSRIRVASWDGVPPVSDQLKPGQDSDLLLLDNRDVLSGTFQGLNEVSLTFKTPFDVLQIPVASCRRVMFANRTQTIPPPSSDREALVLLRDGSRHRMEISSITGEFIDGISSVNGKTRITRPSVVGIFWNRKP